MAQPKVRLPWPVRKCNARVSYLANVCKGDRQDSLPPEFNFDREISFRKLQIFHFANYRFYISQTTDFSFRKLQIFHFANYRFSFSFRFVSQTKVSHLKLQVLGIFSRFVRTFIIKISSTEEPLNTMNIHIVRNVGELVILLHSSSKNITKRCRLSSWNLAETRRKLNKWR